MTASIASNASDLRKNIETARDERWWAEAVKTATDICGSGLILGTTVAASLTAPQFVLPTMLASTVVAKPAMFVADMRAKEATTAYDQAVAAFHHSGAVNVALNANGPDAATSLPRRVSSGTSVSVA